MQEDFNLSEFKETLKALQVSLEEAIQQDSDYHGEVDEVLGAMKRLQKELSNEKHKKLIADILMVLSFVDMFTSEDEDDDEIYDIDEDEESDDPFQEVHEELIQSFSESSQHKELSEEEQEDASFILECFCELASEIESPDPSEWTKENVEKICLELFPAKVSAEAEVFQHVGPVLIAFFNFLSEHGLLKQAKKLITCVKAIRNKIPQLAEDPENWGMAKTFTLEAMKSNIDLTDPVQRAKFITQFNTSEDEK